MINEKEDTKTCDNIHKEPSFFWTKELVAEFAHDVAMEYKTATLWSGNLETEKQLANIFIKRKKFEERYKDLILFDTGNVLAVDKQKLEDIIKLLFNYRDCD